jgi:hypothetical protein
VEAVEPAFFLPEFEEFVNNFISVSFVFSLYDRQVGEWLWTSKAKLDTEERIVFHSHKDLFELYKKSPKYHVMSLATFSLIMRGHYRKAKVKTDCCSICQSTVKCSCADEALARRIHIRVAYLQQNSFSMISHTAPKGLFFFFIHSFLG